jgi:hypothetical protein
VLVDQVETPAIYSWLKLELGPTTPTIQILRQKYKTADTYPTGEKKKNTTTKGPNNQDLEGSGFKL